MEKTQEILSLAQAQEILAAAQKTGEALTEEQIKAIALTLASAKADADVLAAKAFKRVQIRIVCDSPAALEEARKRLEGLDFTEITRGAGAGGGGAQTHAPAAYRQEDCVLVDTAGEIIYDLRVEETRRAFVSKAHTEFLARGGKSETAPKGNHNLEANTSGGSLRQGLGGLAYAAAYYGLQVRTPFDLAAQENAPAA